MKGGIRRSLGEKRQEEALHRQMRHKEEPWSKEEKPHKERNLMKNAKGGILSHLIEMMWRFSREPLWTLSNVEFPPLQVLACFDYDDYEEVTMVTEIREGRKRHVDTWVNLKQELKLRFVSVSYAKDLYNKLHLRCGGVVPLHLYEHPSVLGDVSKGLVEETPNLKEDLPQVTPATGGSSKKGSFSTQSQREECELVGLVSASKSSSIKCFNCLVKGHTTLQYPRNSRMILWEDGTVDNESSRHESLFINEIN
ncbi:hypothetical protein CR513_40418, partial [Mucuna pruriens]